MISMTANYKFVQEEFLFKKIFGNRLQLNSVKFFNNHRERTDIYINYKQLINKRCINNLTEYLLFSNSKDESLITIKIIGAGKPEFSLFKHVFIDILSTRSSIITRYQLILDKHLYNYDEYILANCKIGLIEAINSSDSKLNYAYINEKHYYRKHNMILYKVN